MGVLALAFLESSISALGGETITLKSLLAEMTDPAAVARLPEPEYQCLQETSYNRASTNRNQPDQTTSGWFADSDGTGFIRTEMKEGKREWVLNYGWAGGVNPTRADEFSTPFIANVRVGGLNADSKGYNICARTRSLDAIPFKQRLVFDMESSFGTDMRHAWDLLGYSVVTYWYAKPGATHNRPALPQEAAKPIVSLEQALKQSAEIKARR